MNGLSDLSKGRITKKGATVLVHEIGSQKLGRDIKQRRIIRITSTEGFAADLVLCKNRPKPAYYDAYLIQSA